jgi:hypothetical protein
MAKLTKADAARQLGIARSTLYKLIDQGKVSPTPDGLVDQAELVRVAAYADTIKGRPRTSADALVDILREQIQTLRDELQEARAERQAAREREALLLHMLQEMQHRYDRLLDMPRPSPQESPQDAPGATQARRRPESPPRPQRPPQGRPEAQGGPSGRHAPAHCGPAPGPPRRPYAR